MLGEMDKIKINNVFNDDLQWADHNVLVGRNSYLQYITDYFTSSDNETTITIKKTSGHLESMDPPRNLKETNQYSGT